MKAPGERGKVIAVAEGVADGSNVAGEEGVSREAVVHKAEAGSRVEAGDAEAVAVAEQTPQLRTLLFTVSTSVTFGRLSQVTSGTSFNKMEGPT